MGSQKLDLSDNALKALPSELSSFRKLKELLLGGNSMEEVPVGVLSALTALNTIDLSYQCNYQEDNVLRIRGSLTHILHPGLVKLDLRQKGSWNPNALFLLGSVWAALLARDPIPTLHL